MSAQLNDVDRKHLSLLWAGPDRSQDIAALHGQLFDPAWSADSLRKMLDEPAITAFVATVTHPAEVVGFVIGRMAADEGEILSIGVAPNWQHRGIGLSMVEGLLRAFAVAGLATAHLEVAADNTLARALYAKAGFEVSGRRKGYYERSLGPPVDAILMRRGIEGASE